MNDIFFGIHVALSAQALIACVFCLFDRDIKNKIIGCILLVVIHNAFRGPHMAVLIEPYPWLDLVMNITTSQFYLPLLFLYLFVHQKTLKFKDYGRVLWSPFVLVLIGVSSMFFWNYLSARATTILIIVYDGSIALVIMYYMISGVLWLQDETKWTSYKRTYMLRVRTFFWVLGSYFSLVVTWNFLRVIGVMDYFTLLDEVILFTQRYLFYAIMLVLPLYGYSSNSRLKKHFPVKIKVGTDAFGALKTEIDRLFNLEKPHLNQSFSANNLYQMLNFSTKEVRFYIEEHHHMSVPDYISQQRVVAFKEAISSNEHETYDIYGVAQKCGFKSRSNFYRIFKAFEGITPTEFINNK